MTALRLTARRRGRVRLGGTSNRTAPAAAL